jgi:type I restriction enzyme R subunit
VLIDAVGVEKSLKTESRPLEKKPGVALKDLLQGVAMGSRDDDTVLSLANRLVRLAKQLDDKAQARIEKASGGIPSRTGQGPDCTRSTPMPSCKPRWPPPRPRHHPLGRHPAAGRNRSRPRRAGGRRLRALRQSGTARRDRKRPPRARADHRPHQPGSGDLRRLFSEQAEAQAKAVIQTFADYLETAQGRDRRADFFYQQPYQRRALTFDMIEELHAALSQAAADADHRAPVERLCPRAGESGERGRPQRQLTDLVSLVRFALGHGGRAQALQPTKSTSASRPGSFATTPSAARRSRPSRPNGCG